MRTPPPSSPRRRTVVRRAIAIAGACAALAVLISSCASSPPSVCDPLAIEHNGRCFLSQQEACDAAGCVPPAQCEIVESKPAHVECHGGK